MFRLGVIGGECSHAEYFAYYFNKKNDKGEYNFPNYRVTAISGHYKKENQIIAEQFNVDKVYDNPLDMLDKVDAIMITARDGKYHFDFVKPFLEKYHIQGSAIGTVHLGAYYNNNLIGVMSFLKEDKNGNWNLTRFATDINYICCGVGGKLFKYFIKNYDYKQIYLLHTSVSLLRIQDR